MNCVRLYIQINLTIPNDVTNAARPSRITIGTHSIFGFLDVNGLATDASALDNDIPAFAIKFNRLKQKCIFIFFVLNFNYLL